MSRIGQLVIILTFVGVVGIIMIGFSPGIQDANISTVMKHLGIAFIVACIVGITVELYVRREMRLQMERMLQEVGSDVFKAVLGHIFPQSIWDQVFAHLLLNPVIRQNMKIDLNLENLPECNGDFVRVQVCCSYTVSNLSSRDWIYQFSAALDRPQDYRFRDQANFNRVEVGGHRLQHERIIIDKRDGEICCRTTITLGPDESKKVEIHGESVYRSDQIFPLAMVDPTENITITISKPSNIALTVDPLHAREDRLEEEPTASPELRKTWRINGGLLPGHGVSIRWFPIQT